MCKQTPSPNKPVTVGQSKTLITALEDLCTFYRTIFYFLWYEGSFADCPHFKGDTQARCHLYSLSLILYLWNRPHYRNGTFQEDMVKNLRNVAVPGTGIPLSIFCYFRVTVLWVMLVAYPLICVVAAYKAAAGQLSAMPHHFVEQLLHPQDWFSYWRLNCRLASLHAHQTRDQGYEFEDKWTFLTLGKQRGVSVTPWLKTHKLFVKHRNEEGGLGCASYSNAAHGGDWIIQECLTNGAEIAPLLPEDAPLSTFRVMTASDGGLSTVSEGCETVRSLSCVFRAGRAGAMTDHSSILFDVDTATGTIRKGTTNQHWYELGLSKIASTPWTSAHDTTHHPDCGALIAGQQLPNIAKILKTAEDAHRRLSPGVPIIGWDVAVTDRGFFLLEGNFSSNFFRGTFDKAAYFDFVSKYFVDLEKRRKAGSVGKQTVAAAAPTSSEEAARRRKHPWAWAALAGLCSASA